MVMADIDSEKKSQHITFSCGEKIKARFKGKDRYLNGEITRVNSDGTYDIVYVGGDHEQDVKGELIESLDEAETGSKEDEEFSLMTFVKEQASVIETLQRENFSIKDELISIVRQEAQSVLSNFSTSILGSLHAIESIHQEKESAYNAQYNEGDRVTLPSLLGDRSREKAKLIELSSSSMSKYNDNAKFRQEHERRQKIINDRNLQAGVGVLPKKLALSPFYANCMDPSSRDTKQNRQRKQKEKEMKENQRIKELKMKIKQDEYKIASEAYIESHMKSIPVGAEKEKEELWDLVGAQKRMQLSILDTTTNDLIVSSRKLVVAHSTESDTYRNDKRKRMIHNSREETKEREEEIDEYPYEYDQDEDEEENNGHPKPYNQRVEDERPTTSMSMQTRCSSKPTTASTISRPTSSSSSINCTQKLRLNEHTRDDFRKAETLNLDEERITSYPSSTQKHNMAPSSEGGNNIRRISKSADGKAISKDNSFNTNGKRGISSESSTRANYSRTSTPSNNLKTKPNNPPKLRLTRPKSEPLPSCAGEEEWENELARSILSLYARTVQEGEGLNGQPGPAISASENVQDEILDSITNTVPPKNQTNVDETFNPEMNSLEIRKENKTATPDLLNDAELDMSQLNLQDDYRPFGSSTYFTGRSVDIGPEERDIEDSQNEIEQKYASSFSNDTKEYTLDEFRPISSQGYSRPTTGVGRPSTVSSSRPQSNAGRLTSQRDFEGSLTGSSINRTIEDMYETQKNRYMRDHDHISSNENKVQGKEILHRRRKMKRKTFQEKKAEEKAAFREYWKSERIEKIGHSELTVPKRDGSGKSIVIIPKEQKMIWFCGTGVIISDWTALPGYCKKTGLSHHEKLKRLESNEKYIEYVRYIEGLVMTIILGSSGMSSVGSLSTFNDKSNKIDNSSIGQRESRLTVQTGSSVPLGLQALWRQVIVTTNALALRCIEKAKYPLANELLNLCAQQLSKEGQLLPSHIKIELSCYLQSSYARYYIRKDKPHAALDCAQKALKGHIRRKDYENIAISLLHTSYILAYNKRCHEALRCLSQVLDMVEEGKLENQQFSSMKKGLSIDTSSPPAQRIALVAICYHTMALLYMRTCDLGAAFVASLNGRRLARLCLQYSNRWIPALDKTHQAIIEEARARYQHQKYVLKSDDQGNLFGEMLKTM